jgi:hypothetical protein
MKPARARRALRELQTAGAAEIPVPYVQKDGPEFAALRLYEDIFFPANTTDLQRARCIMRREWLTRAEVLERQATEGWSEKFVGELIGEGSRQDAKDAKGERGKEGLSGFDTDAVETRVVEVGEDLRERTGLYEVITAYSREATEDGAIGIFVRKFSFYCSVAATERTLFRRKHGKYPFVFFSREALTTRLIDTRGVPEVVQTDQEGLKLFRDSFADYTQKNTNPPIKKPRGGPKYQLGLQPFGEIEANAREPVEYLIPPPYPRSAEKMIEEVLDHANQYFGRPSERVADQKVQLLAQARVDRFLSALADVLGMTLQLCQEFMPAETVARITGSDRSPWEGADRSEVQGRFDVRLSFDLRDLDQEFMVKKLEVLMKHVRPMDVRGMLPWEEFARRAVAELDPSLAELIPDEAVAGQKVVKDESAAYVKLLNGVEADMPDMIENPQLRLETLARLHGPRVQDPARFQALAPAAQELLDKRIEYLEFQQQQMENAAIGRRGVEKSELSEG